MSRTVFIPPRAKLREDQENGFTLVELMVALLIFGLLAAAGVSLLGFSVRAQGAAQERLDDMADVRRLGAVLTADLAQAAPRISRNAIGEPRVAFYGASGAEGELALAFTRRGWDNHRGDPRPSMQRVEYRLAGDRIERRSSPMLDGAEPNPPATIIRGVRSITLRYRGKEDWRDRWDPLQPAELPRAIELVADIDGLGRLRQLFLTGTGS